MAPPVLEGKIARLPCWRGRVALEPLKGGLSNIAFVATDGADKYVVRCGEDIPAHHVFVHVEPGITVLRFIEGRTFAEADMRANVPRLVAMLKICHREVARHLRGPANMFWPFHVIRDYVRLIDGERRYLDLADKLEAMQVPLPIVFGHHDLLPGNLIDDGTRLWLIDWEYGGFGTAMFDLANLSSNGSFDAPEDELLLEMYFEGQVTEELTVAFEAMKAASLLREALWAQVSEIHLRTPGVDYQAHAREYLTRLARLLSSETWHRWSEV
jgi:thiamine kinase-like enzyme